MDLTQVIAGKAPVDRILQQFALSGGGDVCLYQTELCTVPKAKVIAQNVGILVTVA